MKSFINKTTLAILIFTTGILSAVLSQFHPEMKFLIWILLTVTLIYLFLGWYIFNTYHPQGHPLMLFLMGYLYSGVFIGSVFAAAEWPFTKTILAGSIFWAVVQTVFIIILRKKLPPKSFIQFLIEATVMLTLTISQIIRY
jgi:hypothetical protein